MPEQRCVIRKTSNVTRAVGLICMCAVTWMVFTPQVLYGSDLVNINTADATLLETLPGIGPALALRIIEYRETNGPFASIEEIQNVSGIGPSIFADVESLVTVSGGVSDVPAEDESTKTATSAPETTSSKGEKKERIPVRSIEIFMPEIAYVNQRVSFDVEPDDSIQRLVRYAWNFGDGDTSDTKSPEHMYKYPGTYVVFVKSRYLGEELTARGELAVLPAALSLARTENGDIQLHNDAKYEIDLGGFTLSGEKSFTIPPHTILLSAATLTARRGLLETGSRGLVSLMDPAGTVIAAVLPNETPVSHNEHAAAAALKQSSVPLEAAKPLDTDLEPLTDALPNPEESMVYRPDNAAAAGKARDFDYGSNLPYLGLTGLLLAGIIGVYAKRSI